MKPSVISVVGYSGSGKTTLITKLITELKERGFKIGTIKHAHHGFEMDKIGKDSWKPEEFPTYFRVLESDDEYFPYHKKYHAFWAMYGLDLDDEVLKKVYYKNALRIVPGLDKSLFPK